MSFVNVGQREIFRQNHVSICSRLTSEHRIFAKVSIYLLLTLSLSFYNRYGCREPNTMGRVSCYFAPLQLNLDLLLGAPAVLA